MAASGEAKRSAALLLLAIVWRMLERLGEVLRRVCIGVLQCDCEVFL